MPEIVPLDDRVVVEQAEPEKVTKGGIFLPEQAREKPLVGRVVAIGPAAKQVSVGDWVAFLPYAGNTLQVSGRKFLLMREEECLSTINWLPAPDTVGVREES